jgi:hypothetical protein
MTAMSEDPHENQRACPLPHADVTVFPLDDDLVIYHVRTGQSFVLNQTGRLIWSLCDGTRTMTELAEEVSSMCHITLDQAQTDVGELIRDLTQNGLISIV